MWENSNEGEEERVSRVHLLRSCITKKTCTCRYSKFCLYIPPSPLFASHIVFTKLNAWTTVVYTSGCSCHISVVVHAAVHVIQIHLLSSQIYIIPMGNLADETMNSWNSTLIGYMVCPQTVYISTIILDLPILVPQLGKCMSNAAAL